MKNKSTAYKVLLLVGLILVVAQAVITVVFMTYLNKANLLPVKYEVLIGILLGLFVLLIAITQYWKIPGIVTKALSLVMCVVMIVGSFYIKITSDAISGTHTETQITTVNVYVMAERKITTLQQIKDGKFGILEIDHEYTDPVVEKLEEELEVTLHTVEYSNCILLVEALYRGDVDAIFLNESYVGVVTGYDDSEYKLADFENDAVVITSVDKEEQVVIEDPTQEDETGEVLAPIVLDEEHHIMALYLSGIDVKGSPKKNRNSDVNIICIINTTTKQIFLLNTPRDYYLTVMWKGGVPDKLTHAGCKGINVSVATLENFYGIKLNGYVKVNFSGFETIIDALGGVNVYSAYDFTSYHGKYHFNKGHNEMDGHQALCFCRERYAFPTGDNQRGKNQMELIKAVIQKMQSSEMIKNYTTILESLSNTMVTSLTYEQITTMAQYQITNNAQWEVLTYAVTGKGGNDWCTTQGFANYVMYPNQDSVDKAIAYIRAIYNDEKITIE